jgi:hypothetical protein
MEIALRQKDAEQKSTNFNSPSPNNNNSNNPNQLKPPGMNMMPTTQKPGTLPSALEKALSLGNLISTTMAEQNEITKLHTMFQEKEEKWKTAYEKVVKDYEQLRIKGEESVVASQWRIRYENCLRDKEEIQAKLSMHTQLSSEVNDMGKSLEQLHIELQHEYKVISPCFSLLFFFSNKCYYII